MSLSSIANPAWETIRGVSFSMLHGPTLVTIVVTHAALSEIDDVTPGVGGHLACLQKHRHAFEHVARADLHRVDKLRWLYKSADMIGIERIAGNPHIERTQLRRRRVRGGGRGGISSL